MDVRPDLPGTNTEERQYHDSRNSWVEGCEILRSVFELVHRLRYGTHTVDRHDRFEQQGRMGEQSISPRRSAKRVAQRQRPKVPCQLDLKAASNTMPLREMSESAVVGDFEPALAMPTD